MTAHTIESPQKQGTAGYRYHHGDRPLDGYTIQRGAGRGGFGEVYYALSDSGREVALKVVHTYEQIELRGIGQCMNLKSPHLVAIFDVKYGNDGRPWVIMEYVNGPSLRELLDAAPAGLGVQKAAFFLREIGKGLTELHDCGIVHRDLKPANIFFENGYVKIGDYGLSKLIGPNLHSGQTITVGTVHYMAPEIGAGRYNLQIDVYAMGALLYEMLTGQVPYLGSSPAEVLMKHLNSQVDTTGIEEPFATVIRKAMAKDPADRYASVQEMVEAVFGAEHVRNSVSQFSPDSLSMVAGQAARKMSPQSNGSFTPSDTPAYFPSPRFGFERRLHQMQQHVKYRCNWAERKARRNWVKTSVPADGPSASTDLFQRPKLDPMPFGKRIVLGAIVTAMAAIGATILNDHGPKPLFFVILSIASATTALMLGWRLIAPGLRHESPWLMRLMLGAMAGIASVVLTVPFWAGRGRFGYSGASVAILTSLLILDWPARLTALRKARVTIGQIVTAVIAALVFSGMFDGNPIVAIAAVAGTALVAGLVCGWNPPELRPMTRPAGPPPIGAAPPVPSPTAHDAAVRSDVPPVVAMPAHSSGAAPVSRYGWAATAVAGIGFGVARFVCQLAGLIVLLVSILVTIAVVSNLPGLWNSPAVDPQYARELARQFGTRNWTELVRNLAIGADLILVFIASALLLIPRRRNGALHMFRGLLAIVLALHAAIFFGRALPDWSDFVPRPAPAATIEALFESIRIQGVLVGSGLLILSAFFFFWPPRANRVATA
jgi:serine/threonine protein kinase